MIKILANDSPDKEWNDRLMGVKSATELQTKEYATYVKTELDWKPIFFKFLSHDENILGQLLAFEIPKNITKKINFLKKTKLRFKFGPIIFSENKKSEIINEFKKYIIQKKYVLDCNEHPLDSGILDSFSNKFPIKKWSTFLVNLNLDIDILWKNTDKNSVKKNIKRSESKGVFVKEISFNDLEIYRKIRKDEINQKSAPTLSRLQLRWKTLHPIGFTGFLAFKDEIPLGGILLSTFNGYLIESGIARTKLDFEENFYAQDLLKWKILEWGREKNYRYFDLAGINPQPNNKKEEGIYRYKKKWGGELFSYNIIQN